ncbi:hypothetical protein ACFLXF_03735 [Chloroflexota bacterium]
MRNLTSTLLAAQKKAATIPYVKLEAENKIAGVVRYDWSRLYTGSEDDYYHALTMPGDGSLVRARVTPPSDSRKLYRQRVADPDPESNFSQWIYTSQYNVVAVAAASQGAEVSIFWINLSREIRRIKSTDYGSSWGSPEIVDYSPTTSVYGLAAAYKSNGDLAIFFADQSTLYVKKHIGGSWQSKSAWDKTTGDLSDVACVYGTDWNLVLTGRDSADNYKVWSLIYGDGGDASAGSWSDLKEIASAPSGGDFEYRQPFLGKPDVYRFSFVEKFGGTDAYNRPFWSHSVADSAFTDNLWREPVPFNLSSEYGLAIAYHGDYCWLANPSGVWRAALTAQSLDLTDDVVAIREELGENSGRLISELRNDAGQYAAPGQGGLAVLDIGCHLELSPGYRTASGAEVSPGQAFSLEAYEHTSSGGKASLILHACDGWRNLELWKARQQFRWNKASDDMNVKDIIAYILARVGLNLEVKSQSPAITGFYPDFTISPGDSGTAVIRKLLSFVPDVLFIEGHKVYLVNPQSSDSSVYSYGSEHQIYEGSYRQGAWALNRIQVEGYDTGGAQAIVVNRFGWDEIGKFYDRLRQIEDKNLGTVAEAEQRGDAFLRQSEVESANGAILIPVNCGQQPYDVIDVTDSRAGLSADKKRVLGLTLVYRPAHAEYRQRLWLGAV